MEKSTLSGSRYDSNILRANAILCISTNSSRARDFCLWPVFTKKNLIDSVGALEESGMANPPMKGG